MEIMKVRVRTSAKAIADVPLDIDSPFCKFRGLAKMAKADIEGVLVTPHDILRIKDRTDQSSGFVMVKFGDTVIPVAISEIKDLSVAA